MKLLWWRRTLVDLVATDLGRDPGDAADVTVFADCVAADMAPEPLAPVVLVPEPPNMPTPIIPGAR